METNLVFKPGRGFMMLKKLENNGKGSEDKKNNVSNVSIFY